MFSRSIPSISFSRYRGGFLVLLGVLLVGAFSMVQMPPGVDYAKTFKPATELLLQGKSPYTLIYNPPWVLIPYIPFALLPLELGFKLWFVTTIAIYILALVRMKAHPLAIPIFLLSPAVIFSLVCGNIESLVLLGFTLPPTWGLFLALLKPQMAVGVVIFWAYDAYRKGGFPRLIQTFAPITIALLGSFLIFGLWPLRFGVMLQHAESKNLSFWPMSILPGVLLVYWAIRKDQLPIAIAASPLLAPYTLLYAWVGSLSVFTRKWLHALLAVGIATILMMVLYFYHS